MRGGCNLSHQSFFTPKKNKQKKIIIVTIILLAVLIGGGVFYAQSFVQPVDKNSSKKVNITIPQGSSVRSIGTLLKEEKLIKSESAFRYYIKMSSVSGFQAGTYTFSPSMSLSEMVDMMETGDVSKNPDVRLAIPEGRQLDEIATIIANRTNYTEEEVMNTLDDPAFIEKMKKKYPDLVTDEVFNKDIKHPLEGYLYPATYDHYDSNVSLEVILDKMIGKTNGVLAQYQKEMKSKKYTAHKLLTMASLIEEEATEQVDREKIASVFYNRLEEDMPLQTDPTVLYALGEHRERVYYKDLEVDSPYNTYREKGLTPGPIANSGLMSIKAALEPADTNYLYFLANKDGEVIFTKTLDEHNKEKATHITGPREEDKK
ncbi:endolytic transglycosylase MltG [Priestia flexa]|uniref:endolytic transglycosylase MltG n=1 Tax=Priestia flexa TaxID=86664 RepID=UPI0006855623|nr:endolytic transglycosylase MltG [Priestia flexa]